MYCPNRKCPDYEMNGRHGEYRQGIDRCPYCGEALVADDPSATTATADGPDIAAAGPREGWEDDEPPAIDDIQGDLEPVFETSDPTEVPIVRSFLDAQGIPHVVVGEERFDAFRGSLSPFRFNPRAGVVAFMVPSACADLTRELLVELEETDSPDS
jgi:hypothetical protein